MLKISHGSMKKLNLLFKHKLQITSEKQRHKKTTKVSDLSGFSVLGVADFAENSHQFGVDGGSSQIRTVDLRIKSVEV